MIPSSLETWTSPFGRERVAKLSRCLEALNDDQQSFELAVATAIALYGPESGAALATVVCVLVEVPAMLSVCTVCNRTRE